MLCSRENPLESTNFFVEMEPVHASDDDRVSPVTSEEAKNQLLQRHAEERKDLAKSYERKKSFIPRKDRSGRSRLAEELATAEKKLKDRHTQELKDAGISDVEKAKSASGDVSNLENSVENMVVQAENNSLLYGNDGDQSSGRKESKAARRRRLKAEQEAESERRVADARANQGVSEREEEMKAIQKQLDVKRMRVHPIAPDGHCLYNAVAHQMELIGDEFDIDPSAQALRNATADYMLAHADEFIMFVESVHGDSAKFRAYCDEIRTKAVWGGQVELRASPNCSMSLLRSTLRTWTCCAWATTRTGSMSRF